ncbi:MAG: DUF2637 domain-containing protein, partial [Trebonia sp.]
MSGNKFARILAGLAVLAVAVVAEIVSFTHIEALALAHGYAPGTARLLPVSVDSLIVAASLACLTEARARGEASRLSRAGLVLGIVATLGANVAAGAQFGVVGALVNAWPAVAFIVASEILLSMVRAARDVPSADEDAGTVAAAVPVPPATVPETAAETVPADVPVAEPVSTVPPVPVVAPRAVAARAPRRAAGGKPKAPERVFAAEIGQGELPSLREVKRRMNVGTDRARAILGELASTGCTVQG